MILDITTPLKMGRYGSLKNCLNLNEKHYCVGILCVIVMNFLILARNLLFCLKNKLVFTLKFNMNDHALLTEFHVMAVT